MINRANGGKLNFWQQDWVLCIRNRGYSFELLLCKTKRKAFKSEVI